MPEITIDDLDNLRHMLGMDPRKSRKHWFYRNYFSAPCDHASMNRLELAGWVFSVEYSGGRLFFATEPGMMAVGLTKREIAKIKETR